MTQELVTAVVNNCTCMKTGKCTCEELYCKCDCECEECEIEYVAEGCACGGNCSCQNNNFDYRE